MELIISLSILSLVSLSMITLFSANSSLIRKNNNQFQVLNKSNDILEEIKFLALNYETSFEEEFLEYLQKETAEMFGLDKNQWEENLLKVEKDDYKKEIILKTEKDNLYKFIVNFKENGKQEFKLGTLFNHSKEEE